MNKFFLSFIVLCLGGTLRAQVNFVRTWSASAPITDPDQLMTRPLLDVKQNTQYVDGLGRPTQLVAARGSQATRTGSYVDLVSMVTYDTLGRQISQYLPYPASTGDGSFKTDAFTAQPSFYGGATSPVVNQSETGANARSLMKFEISPLSRVNAQLPPGNNWIGAARGVQTGYYTNTVADSVRIFSVTDNGVGVFGTYTMKALYPLGTLIKNIVTDEAGNQRIEFKDKDGKMILTKVQLTATDNGSGSGYTGWLCTYYIYDIQNNLRCVVQPTGVSALVANSWSFTAVGSLLGELCFRYEYDQRNRVVMKQVPGAGTDYMVYDVLDRLIMTQDPNLRALTEWIVTVYDILNRPIKTGLLTDATAFATQLSNAYNSTSYPSTASNFELLSQTFYDDYSSWITGTGLSSSLISISSSNFITSYGTSPNYAVPVTASYQTRRLLTGTMTKVVGTASQYLYKVNFYDDRARGIQTEGINYTGGIDTTTTQYDFNGNVLRMVLGHKKNGNTVQSHLVLTKFSYDSLKRVKAIWKNIDQASSDQLIDSFQYDNVGELKAKYLGNNVDSLVYDYNIRGWLLGINRLTMASPSNNNTYFSMELAYDKTSSAAYSTSYNAAQYNGNIAGLSWKTYGDPTQRKYDLSYDKANRLTSAAFNQLNGTNWQNTVVDFSVNNLGYDANGNILLMTQRGFTVGGSSAIDSLVYSYTAGSNKLSQVVDRANNPATLLGDFHYPGTKGSYDYTYDGNGNLKTDNNKAIDNTTFNYLNLPQLIHMNTKGNIAYTYDAAGTKLKKVTADSTSRHATTTLYIGPFTYQQTDTITNPTGGVDTLQFIAHEEGRTRWGYHKFTTGVAAYKFEYDFFEKDHLGNTRMLLTQQRDTSIYLASMEGAYRSTEIRLFGNIANTVFARTSAPGYPVDYTYSTPNDSVSKVDYNGSTGQKTGPSLLLKVMSGDTVGILVNSYFNSNSITTTNSSFNDVLTSLANGLVNMTGGSHGSVVNLTASGSSVFTGLTSFVGTNDQPPPTGYPKAYLNWIFLDDQFNYVQNLSSAVQAANATYYAGHLNTVAPGNPINITKNGYLYIWVSNETQGWDVFFDNLKVQHKSGPILEENHYYPFGLTMAGISDKALKTNYTENKYRYNKGSELQNKEFSDGTGLEMYATHFRQLDPQLGRWWQIDPKPDYSQSLYSSMNNNPILATDPLGDTSVQFGPDGSFLRFQDDGKKNFTGIFYEKSKVESTYEKNGVRYENRTYSQGIQFSFNDPKNDVLAIKNGIASGGSVGITGVELMTDKKVDKQIANSGVQSPEALKSPYSYVLNQPTGKMDYGVRGIESGDLNPKKFYIREGVAYNIGDIGNYLWGRAMAYLGISVGISQMGAHYNNIMHGEDQKTPLYDFGPGTYGNPGFWDSPDDQRAIFNGYNNSPPTIEAQKSFWQHWMPYQ